MTIATISAWNFGHTIDQTNNSLNFDEGAGELLAELRSGAYSMGDFIAEISRAMNEKAQVQEYTASLDRTTRLITITAAANFDLLASSGTNISTGVWTLMGYSATDLLADVSFEGDLVTGSQYTTQFLLQKFVDFNDNQKAANSTVNETASGQVEVIKYGNIKIMECTISFATNIVPQGLIIESATGLDDLRTFMLYATTKAPLEFIPDESDQTIFTKCLLESTPTDSKGTGFLLKELYSRGLTGYFETGKLKFRELF